MNRGAVILYLCVTTTVSSAAVNASSVRSTPHAAGGTLLRVPLEERVNPEQFWTRYSKRLGLDARGTMVASASAEIVSGRGFQRYWQYHQGIRVTDGEFILHLVNGVVAYGTGRVIPDAQLPGVQPTVTSEVAFESAERHLAATLSERPAALKFVPGGVPSLVLIPSGAGAKRTTHRLAYRLKLGVAGRLSPQLIDVDARSARVLRVEPLIVEDTETVTATGPSLYNGTVVFSAQKDTATGVYRLETDTLRTLDMSASPDPITPPDDFAFGLAEDFTSQGDAFPQPAAPGVSTHWALGYSDLYFRQTFNVTCLDLEPAVAYVGMNYKLAWTRDTRAFLVGKTPVYFTALDALGHEMTHCIDQRFVEMYTQGEPGTLDESFGDIFGTLIERMYRTDWDWTQGLELYPGNPTYRRLDDPTQSIPPQPDTYETSPYWWSPDNLDQDRGGVHHNDGVPNKWFYLAAQGGQGVNANGVHYDVTGAGVDTMARIAFQAFTAHLLPESGFDDARTASVLAAGEVCGDFSQERISTEDAWWAVGVVGSGPPVTTPFSSPSTGAVDVEPWKARLEWEAYQVNPESEWDVQVSEDTAFADYVGTSTSDTATENGILVGVAELALKPHTHYYWRVRRKVSDPGLSCWRPTRDFTTSDKRPTTISPVRQEFYPWGLPFKWSAISRATGYTLEVATDPNFSPASLIFASVESVSNETVLSVKVKSQLYWHVRASFAPDAEGQEVDGRWSKAARFSTRIPRVKLISPIATAEGPWPVEFKWEKNPAADHYLLEVTGEKFDPSSPSYRQLEERPHPHIPGPAHDSLNFDVSNPPPGTFLIPMSWRVRVFGSPPLNEEGIPEERHFHIDAKKTLVTQLEPQGAYCAPLEQELTFTWKRVKNAQSYMLECQEALWGVPSSDSFPILIPAPASDTQTQSTSFKPTVPQNNLAVGYLWRVRAIGPEGLRGWAYPAQVYFIKPEAPVLISPYNPSSLAMPADGVVTVRWHSVMSHRGEYTVELWRGPAGQPSCGAGGVQIEALSINGPSQGDLAASVTVQEQDSGVDYSWRVAATDVASCYVAPEPLPYSNCAIFHIAKSPPPTVAVPDVPQTIARFGGNVGLMAMIFTFVPNANHYKFEVNAGNIQDETVVGSLLGTADRTAAEIALDDDTIAQQGLPLPAPWHIVLINNVPAAQAYQWRVAACADAVCSAWSAYNYFASYLPWPF